MKCPFCGQPARSHEDPEEGLRPQGGPDRNPAVLSLEEPDSD